MESNERIEEVTRENAIIIWQASRLSIGMKCEKAPEILKANGTVVGTLGNFSASIGKAKSKKTFNVSAIVAAALKNGTVLLYSAELPKDKRKILYVDTEQSPYHCLKVMERILRMAGLPTDRDSEHLEFLALRKYTPKERIAAVEQAIYNTPELGLVVIDGIRDMVYDINSPGESTRIISKLMQWTDDRQVHIHTILHQNKGDENARGHIGTELNNKAEPCTSGRWTSSRSPSASMTGHFPNWWRTMPRRRGRPEDRSRSRLTRTGTSRSNSTASLWRRHSH